jgi:replication factor C subunit 3/5
MIQIHDKLAGFKRDSFPHLLFEGPRGAGKMTQVYKFLAHLYLHPDESLPIKSVYLSSDKLEEIHTLSSKFHYQINPSTYGVNDRHVLQYFVEEIVKYKPIGTDFRIFVIEDADLLTEEAQQFLRRILEIYISTCRFIFISNMEGDLIDPIASRCVRINFSSPTAAYIRNLIISSGIEPESADKICKYVGRNIGEAIHYIEMYKINGRIEERDEVQTVRRLIERIKTVKNISEVQQIRDILYDLLVNCMSSRDILNLLTRLLVEEENNIHELCRVASECDEQLRHCSKEIYHLEKFCLHAIKILAK